MARLDAFFESLWRCYTAMTPQAERIHQAFVDQGEEVLNDHVAFRTLGLEPLGLDRLEPHLTALGYTRFEPYDFPEKKLRAYGYLPPQPNQPRVFLSELKVEELSSASQDILRRCAEQVDPAVIANPEVLWAGRLWEPIRYDEYGTLLAESEYAAWVATLGLCPNHFTISVTDLKKHAEVEDVLKVVEDLGYAINESGGRVKGSPDRYLEQASTLADRQMTDFAGGAEHETPTCYYEFAKRYPLPSGELFQGFVAASADKIFESTDAKQK